MKICIWAFSYCHAICTQCDFQRTDAEQNSGDVPELWVDEDEEEGKNLNEGPLIQTQLDRYRRHNSFSYYKINDSNGSDKFLEKLSSLKNNDLNVVVVNFIDMLSHARTESKMVRELASNESAYRSITLSWFRHSFLSELFKTLSQTDYKVIITTDHGSIRASKPIKIIGDRKHQYQSALQTGQESELQLQGSVRDQGTAQGTTCQHLISARPTSFATGDTFFAYPNNYNYYVSYYNDTFQHGGISMEEMLILLITMTGREKGRDLPDLQ